MGIPAFYRWLLERYPRSVVEVLEDSPAVVNGVQVPVDTTKPNPNGFEFDNLYLDMNGIIHPCFHPENMPAPESYDEVFKLVFKYIDRIFSLIRPRKLLYMAIDGVAPRAKMNQQRARRFRAARDAADQASVLEKKGVDPAEERGASGSEVLDSNVITPGTGFMELLSSALQYYIHLKMNHDPGWQGIKVILSDASVPGEGEHKIMSYIRLQRNLPGFDPNTRHCLYGLDADLIMLALATHEVHFSVLREDVRKAPVHNMNRTANNGLSKASAGPCRDREDAISRQKFQLLNVWVLREYLEETLKVPDQRVKADLERLIDDFVFMCLFVGNDFLPHVPSLEISECAIDLLITVYKKEFVRMGGYLTDCSEINLKRVEHFIQAVASHETAIFRKRRQEQIAWERHSGRFAAIISSSVKESKSLGNQNCKTRFVVDKVNLGEDGWKERYYSVKFDAQSDDDRQRVQKDTVLKYVEGICWVMHYYYRGVCSWKWFYPYHYAPFASDFRGLDKLTIQFSLGEPFKPFNQLMGVLPAASAQALPLCYRNLMTDPSSPILDFYPTDFEVDLNGRKQAWKAICKLPFIDECRLLKEIATVEHTLTDEEKRRNTLSLDRLFIHKSLPLARKIIAFSDRNKDNPKLHKAKVKRKINPKSSCGMNGYIYISNEPICPSEISSPLTDMEKIQKNEVIFVFYNYPQFHPHIPRPPEGVTMPEKSIRKRDLIRLPTLWHQRTVIAERRFDRRAIPLKSVAGPSLAKLAHRLVSGTAFVSGSEDQGEGRKRKLSDDGKKKRKKRNKKRKLNKPIDGSGNEDKGEAGERKLGKEDQGEAGERKLGNEDQGEVGEGKPSDNGKKKRKKRNKKRKLNKTSDGGGNEDQGEAGERKLGNEDQGEVGEGKPSDNGKKKRKKRNKKRKLNKPSDGGGNEDQGEAGERKLGNEDQGETGERKLGNEDQGEVGEGKPSDDSKKKRKKRNKKRKLNKPSDGSGNEDQGEVGEGKPSDDSKKKRKKRNKKRKLNKPSDGSGNEDQGEAGERKLGNEDQGDVGEKKLGNYEDLVGERKLGNEDQGDVGERKLGNEDQGEVGERKLSDDGKKEPEKAQ